MVMSVERQVKICCPAKKILEEVVTWFFTMRNPEVKPSVYSG